MAGTRPPPPPIPSEQGYKPASFDGPFTHCAPYSSLAFDAATGMLASFALPSHADAGKVEGRGTDEAAELPAQAGRGLGSLEYHTLSQADYTQFIKQYSYEQPPPAYFPKDFGKVVPSL